MNDELDTLIRQCINGNRRSQEKLYKLFYAYGMNVTLHYSQNREEAMEILNEGFFKAFNNLQKCSGSSTFKPWFRRILINASIDYHRKYNKTVLSIETEGVAEPYTTESGFDNLAMDDLLAMIQQLTPVYRMVFNLYILEGFSHKEIAEKLNISIGASKSNLSRAKGKLQEILRLEEKKKVMTEIKMGS